MPKLIIHGSKGRMGQTLLACAARLPEIQVVGQVDQGDDLGSVIAQTDVVVDFSLPSATAAVTALCARHQKALVIGTTGHNASEKSQVHQGTAQIPIVWASNYSTGVNTLYWLTRKAAEILGPDFDLEIIETHHRMKKDAPSGTAKNLAEILAAVRALQYNSDVRHGRFGDMVARTKTEIGMHVVLGGDVVGDHTGVWRAP